ncbi:hypothetical protein LshimejAT787_0300970 [Lyophyllum shimeji]|uniref:ZZ-type domain-containing protein n=1 Tax=Lyophyllum shimeji TaxID=47721 RepID=A0A9P3PHZ9_LYOSH|nr:hypothetical protein LshimejAT787_0300970 [Lyophyllum shimeji]
MFSVKATYRGEIRRFSFPDSTTFPTFDQLQLQLHRVFPSSSSYYLSKLLFCPDSSKPGRILIAREVHTAEDYNKCLVPFRGRSWPNALLRFSLLDENTSGFASKDLLSQPVGQVPWRRDDDTPSLQSPETPRPLSAFYIPPAPVTFSVPPRAFVQTQRDIDPVLVDVSNQHSQTAHPAPPPPRPNASGCCNTAEAKVEIQNLIDTFQQDLNRILIRTFGHTASTQNAQHPNTLSPPSPSAVPGNRASVPSQHSPFDCSLCRRPVVGQRATCSACSSLVCSECNSTGRADFCPVSFGPHILTMAPSPGVPLSNGSYPLWPHAWSSWSPRPLPPLPPVAPAWVPSSSSTYNTFAYPSRNMSNSPPVGPFIPPLRSITPEADSTFATQTSSSMPRAPSVHMSSPAVPQVSASRPPTPPPPQAIHRGIICDACDSTIVGVRHKCLDCPDYDLCTPCITSGSSERHNPRHQFFELAEPTRIVVHTVNQDDGPAPLDPASFAPAAPLADLPAVHNATCDLCDSLIQGDRYKCTVCPDFDTCNSCFTITEEQHPEHSFVKLSKAEDYIPRVHLPPPHHFARCDVCNKSIDGVRYKCMHPDCPDFDLCEKCEALPIPQHPENHPMLKMKSVETVIPTVYRVGQTSMHLVPERPRAPDFEHGYMRNPALSWGTVASEPPSPVERTSPESPSLGATGTRTYESVERDPGSVTSEFTPAHPDRATEPFPLHRRVSPTSWSPSVDCSPHPLRKDAPSPSSPRNWAEATNPHFPTIVQSHPRRTGSHVHQEEPLAVRFDPAVETFHASPSSPLTSEVSDVHGTPPPAPLINGSWFGESLSSLLKPIQEQAGPVVSSDNLQTAEPDSPSPATAMGSPLNNEALLSRPPVTEMQQITPPNSRSLAELLNGYRSMSNIHLENQAALERSLTPDVVEEQLSARFVEDVTAPDGQIFAAGVTFIKIWRMQNDGARDWPASTEVVFAGGAQLASGNPPPHIQPMRTVGPLKPGEEKNIWTCELKAPDAPGKYTSYWRLRDDKGQLFGDTIWVEIEVVNPSYSQNEAALSSSSIIVMPDPTSPRASPSAPLSERSQSTSPPINTEATLDDAASDSDSVSLISLPSSEDEDDAALWADSRERVPVDRVVNRAQAMEYVLLYDDNTSEDEE